MSEDNFFTIGRYSTICSTPNGVYRTYYNPGYTRFNGINSTINFMRIEESDVSYLNTKLATAIPQLPTNQKIRDTLGITVERHNDRALTIGGGEDNCLETVLKLDRLIPDNSFLYCIPTVTFVVYLNVLYNLFMHTRVEGETQEDLPITLDSLLEIWCSLPKKVSTDSQKHTFTEVVLQVVEMLQKEEVLQTKYSNYLIFLDQPKYLMAGILNLIHQKLGEVGPSLYVTKINGEYSVTEFTEAANLCSNIKKLYHACLSCPIADSCVPNLVENDLSPVVFKEASVKSTLVKAGMEYIPPGVAAFTPESFSYTYHRMQNNSITSIYRPSHDEANSLAANFIPEETRKKLDIHLAKRLKIKQFNHFKATTCANCALSSICSQNLVLDYEYIDKLQSTCPTYIKPKDLDVSKKSILEFILAAATSGNELSIDISTPMLDIMVTEIGNVLVEAKFTLEAKKAIRFIEFMANEDKHIYKGMFVLPTKLIQVLNKYARYFTIKYGSTRGDLFHSQYDTIYHNLGMVPSKADSWVVVKTNTLDMSYSEFLLQSSRNTLENDGWSKPLFSTIGCKDFLYNVNYEASKSLLRSPKIIKGKPNIDVLLLNLALLLTPTERRIEYGWGYGCQYSTISLANKAPLLALPSVYIILANKTREQDLEDPAYPAKFVSMIDTGIHNYWGYYHTRSVISSSIRALSDKEYIKTLALQEEALSKSLPYICINLYLNNPKFKYPEVNLRAIQTLRNKLC